ncbi:MAG: hypothetical protein DRI86_05965 [Bacteroidetes bacterium]|nr:MAG: hypothetical protein DRI86_05965 [Bacteroidota bacterium]
MDSKTKILLTSGVSLVYIAINTFLIANEWYWFSLLPVLLLFAVAFIFSLDLIYLLVAFVTPMSIDITNFGMSIGLSIPSEPILIALFGIFVLKLLHDDNFDKRIFTHPISIAIYFYFAWMLISVLTSSDIVVSLKWFIARLWLIVPTYFFGIIVFKNIKNIPRFIWAFVIGFIPVILFTLTVHANNNFSDHAAHWAMTPFFNDHTSYGAILAMFIPFVLGFSINVDNSKFNLKIFSYLALVLLLVAIFFSISRAAWASLVGAFGVFIMIKFRIKFSWVLSAASVFIILAFSFSQTILQKLEKNKQDSSDNFIEHVESMSNIATDASNLERINRWNSALHLFYAKPVFGWGPGTYQFVYAPFQNVADKTVISTNVGNKGTAHSEYLLILSEQGVFGLISLLSIFILIITTSIRAYNNSINQKAKQFALLLFLGLITYILHAFFNNFLDTDKASIPFWGFAAAIVAIDIYHTKNNVKGE